MSTISTDKKKVERKLYIPTDLDDKICDDAATNGLSPTQQIKMILTQHYNEKPESESATCP